MGRINRMLKDDRVKVGAERSLFSRGDVSDKLERRVRAG